MNMRGLYLVLPLFALGLTSSARARDVPVSDSDGLLAAIAGAKPGDVITLASGNYALKGATCGATATATEPITVRSATPLAAKIKLDAVEGFKVTGAHWHFEGLDITGVCPKDDDCEHAFHVTGNAAGFVLRDSRVFDFNAQLKVNSVQIGGTWRIPHGGLVEGNELGDAHARDTAKPTTKLNIDTGDGWIVRGNYIHDAHKGGGDTISYAAFMKSGGNGGLFERNLVICSRTDTSGGVRIGLSFGGGGTGAAYCAPAFSGATCDPEHTGGIMRNNIIVNCSDVGIYLNKAKDTKLLFNTLIATTGIDFRYASSTGEAHGNVLSGKIRTRDGATFTRGTNLSDVTSFDSWYVAPLLGDLTKKGDLSALLQKVDPRGDVTDDYCERTRSNAKQDLGALEHTLGDCDTTLPPSNPGGPVDFDAGIGPSDAGSQGGDASSPSADAATAAGDAGARDAGAGGPGGEDDDDADGGASVRGGGGGGGCSTSPGASSWGWPLAAVALLLARRRR